MAVEIILQSIFAKVWDQAGIELATPWSSQTCYWLRYAAQMNNGIKLFAKVTVTCLKSWANELYTYHRQ